MANPGSLPLYGGVFFVWITLLYVKIIVYYVVMTSDDKRKDVIRAIRLVYDSLESHLDIAGGDLIGKKCCDEAVGRPAFHRKCIKEYSDILKVLADRL